MHGMCSSSKTDRFAGRDAPGPAVARQPSERVADADREKTATLLRNAFADGILYVEEFDQRLSGVYAATTVADLDAITQDLPSDWRKAVEAEEKAARRRATHSRWWRAQFRTYLAVMLLLVGIWALTLLPADEMIHPWPIWPAMGWGLSLFLSRPRGAIARTVTRATARVR